MNPVTTTALGLSVTQLADIIQWLITRPITAPPQNVTMAMAAFLFGAGHAAYSIFVAYFPPKVVEVKPEVKPAQ